MRINRLVAILLMLATITCASAQRTLPVTVRQYLEKQAHLPSYHRLMALDGQFSRFVPPRVVDGREMVDAFIAVDSSRPFSMLRSLGVEINSEFDGFITAQVPVDRLSEVSMLPGVTDVEISSRLQLCTDSTMSATHVNSVLNGMSSGLPMSYDGSGVIVGVIDVGFDYQHLAFRSSSDPTKSRIVRVYDTRGKTGKPAYYNGSLRLPGSVYMDDQIYTLSTDNATGTHGTHTASIAAGTHINGYGGMAPGADIVLCAVSVLDGSMSAVEVANCVRYIDSYADSVGKPCVMSMSVSTLNGQHDGQDYLSRAICQTMGPGRIFVISAGNNAGRNYYTHKLASLDNPINLLYKSKTSLGDSTYYYRGLLGDIWMRSPNANNYFKVHVLDQFTGRIVWESQELSGKTRIEASELAGYFDCYESGDTVGYIKIDPEYSSYGKKYHLELSIHNLINHVYSTVNGVRTGRYALGMSVYPRKDTPCVIDAWTCNTGTGFGSTYYPVKTLDGTSISGFYSAPSDSCCIGTYAVGDSTISVGAYAARNSYYSLSLGNLVTDNNVTLGQIASFSSYQAAGVGPTGKALPDICAPGIHVVAAGSRYSSLARNSRSTVMNVDGNYWFEMSGTSMAAPTVAGIIALWLQADPNLSVADVKEVLAQTAQHDRFTSQPQFGPNGKIDALAGLQYVLKNKGYIVGDVNHSGEIDIIDVVALINHILGKSTGFFDLKAADVNLDGMVDILDLTMLINMILHG